MEFEGQARLFDGETVAVEIQLYHDGPHGWVVRVKCRRDLQTWTEGREEFYAELSASEAVDVVVASLHLELDELSAGDGAA